LLKYYSHKLLVLNCKLLKLIWYFDFHWYFILATPVSRSSSRASTGSRPFSPTGSETSEISEPEVFTTVQSETRNVGGRNETTRTYQTHVVQTRNVNAPARSSTSTPTRTSKIPKLTPKKRWKKLFNNSSQCLSCGIILFAMAYWSSVAMLVVAVYWHLYNVKDVYNIYTHTCRQKEW
jgi:hypothetical protein